MSKIKYLKTVANYAHEKGVTVQTVYKWIEQNKVKSIEVDGVKFININENGTE